MPAHSPPLIAWCNGGQYRYLEMGPINDGEGRYREGALRDYVRMCQIVCKGITAAPWGVYEAPEQLRSSIGNNP